MESQEQVKKRLNAKMYTVVKPYQNFYLAENYHQKYYLQRIPEILRDLSNIYPDFKDLANSTAATKINSYIAGYGRLDRLEQDIGKFGLSESSQQRLLLFYNN